MSTAKELLEQATPLPWHIRKSIHGPAYRHVQIGRDKGYTTLDLLPADARLIVYAVNRLPDYEALRKAAEATSRYWGHFAPHYVDDMRAALARLRGES